MSLIQRTRNDADWPAWFRTPAPDLFKNWSDLLDGSGIRIEEFREDGDLVIRAEMPGIDPDNDVEITVSDHALHLRAERKTESKTENTRGYRSEFRYGSFARSIRLPAGAKASDVKASYRDGILEVRLPVDTDEAESTKVPITRT